MQPNEMKEVDFETYCAKCEFKDNKEDETPCDDCLEEQLNLHSKKPVKFRERKENRLR